MSISEVVSPALSLSTGSVLFGLIDDDSSRLLCWGSFATNVQIDLLPWDSTHQSMRMSRL